MIISNTCQFIFIHAPKAEGTTLSSAFAPTLSPADISLSEFISKENSFPHKHHINLINIWADVWGLNKHSTHEEIAAKLPANLYSKYFKMSCVRNPYTHVSSWFFYMLQNFNQPFGNITSLDEFVESKYFLDNPGNFNPMRYRRQLPFVHPISNLDFLARLENLDDDFRYISESLDLKDISLPPNIMNFSNNLFKGHHDIPGRVKANIRKFLADEFDSLGYSK